jgi:hypothetical protein
MIPDIGRIEVEEVCGATKEYFIIIKAAILW